jgi:hypothetical protein
MTSIVGCSIPDPDDLDRLSGAVAGMGAAAKSKLIRYAMNRKAIEWLLKKDANDQVYKVLCYKEDNSTVDVGTGGKVIDVIECLMTHSELSYMQCTDELSRQAANLANREANAMLEERHGDKLSQCYGEVNPKYQEHAVDPEMVDPEAWEDEDLARALIEAPVPMPIPGLPGMLPVLCPLAEHPDAWGCPDTPSGPVGEGGGSGDQGDR